MPQIPGSQDGQLLSIARQFLCDGTVTAVEPLGQGNVNDTYRVTLEAGSDACFVLQRINTHVFTRPQALMGNMLLCSEHVCRRLGDPISAAQHRRWEVPRVYVCRRSGQPWVEAEGDYWRAISYIDRSRTFDVMTTTALAYQVGQGLGMFHALISDLPPEQLTDTLPGFHITPTYLAQYQELLAASSFAASPDEQHCMAFIRAREVGSDALEQARARGDLRLRPIHGDPKINNMMMDSTTGEAIAMIDLDTVKPGLIHYDIGDCLRSGCNPLGEETADWQQVHFDLGLCRAMLEGYISRARSFLTPTDYNYLYECIRLISFELGLRFFSDHLVGDRYFRTRRRGQNLARALVQFQLTQSIEQQEPQIRRIIDALR